MTVSIRVPVACLVLAFGCLPATTHFAQAADITSPAQLTLVGPNGQAAHIFPTIAQYNKLHAVAPDTGPLNYHGGPVMSGPVQLYTIFWSPPKLQTGAASGLPASYVTILNTLATTYPDHGIDNNNTQYYSVSGSKTTYIANAGGHSGSFQDKAAYPASGCSDSVTPGNCLVDSQIQAEVAHAMAVNGWTGGLTKMFLVFTDPGEGSCFTSSSSSCAYTSYCAYHSYFFSGSGEPVIYGNEPYGDPNHCQASGTPSPHGNAAADTAATAASHEISEAITDPELSSWYTLAGSEIGDLCAYIYGTNTWDGGLANQMWAGTFWELQMEWDNHFNGCVQVGP